MNDSFTIITHNIKFLVFHLNNESKYRRHNCILQSLNSFKSSKPEKRDVLSVFIFLSTCVHNNYNDLLPCLKTYN